VHGAEECTEEWRGLQGGCLSGAAQFMARKNSAEEKQPTQVMPTMALAAGHEWLAT